MLNDSNLSAKSFVPKTGGKLLSVLNTALINLWASFRHPAFHPLTTADHSIGVNNSSPE